VKNRGIDGGTEPAKLTSDVFIHSSLYGKKNIDFQALPAEAAFRSDAAPRGGRVLAYAWDFIV
jgi:hypothetical protein